MKVTAGLELPVASPTPKNIKQKDKDFNGIFSECKIVSKESSQQSKDSNKQLKSVFKKSRELKETSYSKEEDASKEVIQIESQEEKEKKDIIIQILNMLQTVSENVEFVPETINQLESYTKDQNISLEELQNFLALLQNEQNFSLENLQALIQQSMEIKNNEIVQPLENDLKDNPYTDSDSQFMTEIELDDAMILKLTGESLQTESNMVDNEKGIEVQVEVGNGRQQEVIKENNITQQAASINIQRMDSNFNTVSSLNHHGTLIPKPLNEAVLNQIQDKIQIHVGEQISEIKMQLRPEHLGNVSLKMEMEKGILIAKFVVESQQVKEIIESQFNTLRDTLSKQGIDVRQVTVSVGQDHLSQHQETLNQQQQNSKKIHRKIPIREVMELYGEEIEEEMILPNIQTNHQVDYSA